MGRDECKLGIWVGLYQMGIKVEFGGFIGGFGKIFFTNGGGIKRGKEGFWGWIGVGGKRKGERDRVFGLRRRWVNIYYI